jgi:hypothetical protein
MASARFSMRNAKARDVHTGIRGYRPNLMKEAFAPCEAWMPPDFTQ